MASVNVQQIINAQSEEVWEIIADFGGVIKILDPGRVKSTSSEGNEPGAIRTITMADNSVILERLELKDESAKRISYTIVGECILPVKEYMTSAKVTPIDETTCQLDWQSTFLPVGDAEQAQATIEGVYLGGIKRIKALLQG